jgi:hypothetical protein
MGRKAVNDRYGVERRSIDETEGLFLAGQKVAPGTYRQVGTFRSVHLDNEDYLPASLNGQVAVYVKRPLTFAEMLNKHIPVVKTG